MLLPRPNSAALWPRKTHATPQDARDGQDAMSSYINNKALTVRLAFAQRHQFHEWLERVYGYHVVAVDAEAT